MESIWRWRYHVGAKDLQQLGARTNLVWCRYGISCKDRAAQAELSVLAVLALMCCTALEEHRAAEVDQAAAYPQRTELDWKLSNG